MTVSRQDDNTLRAALDRADPNTLPDLLRELGLGSLFQGQFVQFRRKVNMVTQGVDAGSLATLHALRLTEGGRAASILRATVRAGGVTGELTPVAFGATPATTQIAVAPNGNIVTLAADAITDLDVVFAPERGDLLNTVFPVVAHVLTLPPKVVAQGVVLLADAEAIEGTAIGRKVVLVPGAGAPAAGQARLNIAKGMVTFAAADAVTRARVKLVQVAAEPLSTLLEGAP